MTLIVLVKLPNYFVSFDSGILFSYKKNQLSFSFQQFYGTKSRTNIKTTRLVKRNWSNIFEYWYNWYWNNWYGFLDLIFFNSPFAFFQNLPWHPGYPRKKPFHTSVSVRDSFSAVKLFFALQLNIKLKRRKGNKNLFTTSKHLFGIINFSHATRLSNWFPARC